jgi:superfamily II DNA or RNA helicase
MAFNNLNLPFCLTTNDGDPRKKIFEPILSEARKFDVGVGFFSTNWIASVSSGLASFIKNGGTSRWIISPALNQDDLEVLINSNKNEDELIEICEKSIEELIRDLEENTRAELSRLINSGVLEFKFAVPIKISSAMYHAKAGYAEDEKGQIIGFSGSYNFTQNANDNWERIDVFNYEVNGSDLTRIRKIKSDFNSLWNGSDSTFKVYRPSEALINKFRNGKFVDIGELKPKSSSNKIELREYQKQAIDNWFKNRCVGSFQMATGSGKTFTALSAIQKLIKKVVEENNQSLFVVVTLPLQHLLDQWYDEAMALGFLPIKCYVSTSDWEEELIRKLANLHQQGVSDVLFALAVNDSFSGDSFQKIISTARTNFLMVADEAHNLGSNTYLKVLPANAKFRLALSATFERFNDPQGTASLFDYFGDPVINFTLADAINNEFLTPYKYYPHKCIMSDEEYLAYEKIQVEIQDLKKADKNLSVTGYAKEISKLRGERTDLLSAVESKISILKEKLCNQEELSHTLVYCAALKGADEQRQIERVTNIIGTELGIPTHPFTSGETRSLRKKILSWFKEGDVKVLTAIKCLDEGVDIPETRTAYILASSANPKEYIQRRGRVLRKADGKEFAEIHDFIVAPPRYTEMGLNMIKRELTRVEDFANIAMNKNEVDEVLNQLKKEFENAL